jgi:NAD(P)-dependent dehydrogenase (short-subunit alcohol dehydrogenase family)
MIEAGRGSIVNVSTVESIRGYPFGIVYGAFKAGVTHFTKCLAAEVAAKGIRVNAIAPDLVESIQVPYSDWVTDDQREFIPRWVPLGRFGQPEDLADVVLFLASDLSRFVTGVTVPTDGGSLAMSGWFPLKTGKWTNRPRL